VTFDYRTSDMDFECIHCGDIDYRSNHWEECKKHPANKIIEQLKNELDLAYKMHDVAVKERDYERSLVNSLMAELNRKS